MRTDEEQPPVKAAGVANDPGFGKLDDGWLAMLHKSNPEARRQGLALLRQARRGQDGEAEARAQLMLALQYRSEGRLGRALPRAQRAADLFRVFDDRRGEVEALAVAAHAASLLARDEEAVDAALLALNLATELCDADLVATCHNYVGVALLWSYGFDRADAAFRDCIDLMTRNPSSFLAVQPLINFTWCECIRLALARYRSFEMPDPGELVRRAEAYEGRMFSEFPTEMLPAAANQLRDVGLASLTLARVWAGDFLEASRILKFAGAVDSGRRGIGVRIGAAALSFARAELTWAMGRRAEAIACFDETISLAARADWEQLVIVAHFSLRQVLQECGKLAEALAVETSLRAREQDHRALRAKSRQRSVREHLALRVLARDVAGLTRRSEEFERQSHEDVLTGLANRRRYESVLSSLLAEFQRSGTGFCVALIDVDDFKCVNDTYSHLAGDEVLKRVSNCLKSNVRRADLPARLAGDEFVIVFPDTSLEIAEAVCERISQSIGAMVFEWNGQPVAVSVSIGVAEVEVRDSVSDLYLRADLSMFAVSGRPTTSLSKRL